jgi:putative membrane protein
MVSAATTEERMVMGLEGGKNKGVMTVLWTMVSVYAVGTIANALFSLDLQGSLLIVIALAFGLVHGAMRYRWSGIVTFIVIALVVSNIMENTSILTGFPFGHYHYTDTLGPKLFLVPLIIGVAYFSTGYLAWTLATVLVGVLSRGSSALTTFVVPFIAAFLMVFWDVCLDPTASTVNHVWIWEQGGGYFGVPLTNYLGWFLTVYVFFQLFALFLRFRNSGPEETQPLSRSFFAQAVVMYGVIGLSFVVTYLVGHDSGQVTDAAGVVWQTASIAEARATVTIFTMIFAAVLSGVKLLQASHNRAGDEPAAALVLHGSHA